MLTEVFRELGGARLAHNMVPYTMCRAQALNIVTTLLMTTAGEDDMSTLLGLMHAAQLEDLELKNAVLKVYICEPLTNSSTGVFFHLLFFLFVCRACCKYCARVIGSARCFARRADSST